MLGLIGCLAFLVVLLFWRINRYEKQVYIFHKRLNKLMRAFLEALPEDKREEFMKKNKINPEAWKEPLRE